MPGPGAYSGEKMPRDPVPKVVFATAGRDKSHKVYIGSLHAKMSGRGEGSDQMYNLKRDFATGMLHDVHEERR